MKAETALILAGIAGAAYLVYRSRSIGQAVNPLNPDNVFYSGASDVATQISGHETTFGGWLWEVLHPGQAAQEQAISAPLDTSPAS